MVHVLLDTSRTKCFFFTVKQAPKLAEFILRVGELGGWVIKEAVRLKVIFF